MDNKAREEKTLASLCKKCAGKCCMGHHIVLSGREYDLLKAVKDFPHGRIDSPAGVAMGSIDAISPGRCPFLADKIEADEQKTACILSADSRPLVCRMFPLTFTCERGRIEFFLSKKCPYAEKVAGLHEWIIHTTRFSRKELASTWSGRERRSLGGLLRKDRGDLLDIRPGEQGY